MWPKQKQVVLFNSVNYNVSRSMTEDRNAIIGRHTARCDTNDRLAALEREVSQIKQIVIAMGRAATGLEAPPPPLPMAPPVPLLAAPVHLHFGLDARRRAHWVDVYSRLVAAGKLRPDEVSGTNFTHLLCGEGTPATGPIRWHGTTRELAYMVRQHLGSRWSVALAAFNDKNDRPLPRSFKNIKPPAAPSAAKIDLIFRSRD